MENRIPQQPENQPGSLQALLDAAIALDEQINNEVGDAVHKVLVDYMEQKQKQLGMERRALAVMVGKPLIMLGGLYLAGAIFAGRKSCTNEAEAQERLQPAIDCIHKYASWHDQAIGKVPRTDLPEMP
jgi:hypothetical protein